jgi:transposase
MPQVDQACADVGFLRQVELCWVAMEACGGSHYWARELIKLGHQVRLIGPQFVEPYLNSGKNDANDTEAIYKAASRPTMRFVPIKTAGQSLRRIRSRLIRAHKAQVNEIRGLLGEFGLVIAQRGDAAAHRLLQQSLDKLDNGLPGEIRELLKELQDELFALDARLSMFDQVLQQQARNDKRRQRLLKAEGIGPISATAIVAAVGDAKQFSNAQLILGARSALLACKEKTDRRSVWEQQAQCRRNTNIATVALANKNARGIWAILNKSESYQPC